MIVDEGARTFDPHTDTKRAWPRARTTGWRKLSRSKPPASSGVSDGNATRRASALSPTPSMGATRVFSQSGPSATILAVSHRRPALRHGSSKVLFEFYPDEITFCPAEFDGLTEQQARDLRHKKGVAYLRS